MAQPLFDDHPLQQYLRAAGEPPEIMPGSSPEFLEDLDEFDTELDEEPEIEWPLFLVQAFEILQSLFASPPQSSPFAERFKYDVISSSLLASSLPVPHSRRRSPSTRRPTPAPEPVDFWLLSPIFVLAAVFLATGYYLFAIVSLGAATLYWYNHADNSKPDMSSTMGALNELISVNALWDSIVQDTVTLLEKEEESPPSPVSAIRLALHSSLNTTQTQCDNVRHIFSALTAPLELAQLAEMYAPPSPRHAVPPSPDPIPYESKRTTWNGSYTSLAGGPSTHVLKKRRSDLSSLLNVSTFRSHSAPNTPPLPLAEVPEEDPQEFGVAALALHRRRTRVGDRNAQAASDAAAHAATMRHPLALSSLHHALDGAQASKRYACSHLLALRFADEDDEGYWEDVRSVMALLTTTFADAAARLTEALEDAEHQDAEFSKSELRRPANISVPHSPGMENARATGERTATSMLTSFAPVPTHLTRFAAHCVAALRDKAPAPELHLRRRRSRTFSLSQPAPQPAEPPAVQAYERLRRELGLALRECERGRDRLLDIVAPPPAAARRGSRRVGGGRAESSGTTRATDGHAVVVAPGDGLAAADDATAHLLLGASVGGLPLPGAEQVFESEAEVGLFTRERSKLTREERIQLAKARRESGLGLGAGVGGPGESEGVVEREKWGPGGEVVQELKDVIWKVGERRRKMTDGQLHSVDPTCPN
ncbi:hypothetical protein DFH09DRAFT_1316242 [Mycena vulgaris]|nr:hypothetical protein DFH09DRAFT_1316242 [Mycena vulgaris]